MKLRDLAERLGCRLEGDGDIEIARVAGIKDAGPGDLTFLANSKYEKLLASTRAVGGHPRRGSGVSRPPACGRHNRTWRSPRGASLRARLASAPPGVHPLAAVAADARLGAHVSIGAFV